jgi:hypothetical protein
MITFFILSILHDPVHPVIFYLCRPVISFLSFLSYLSYLSCLSCMILSILFLFMFADLQLIEIMRIYVLLCSSMFYRSLGTYATGLVYIKQHTIDTCKDRPAHQSPASKRGPPTFCR